MTKLFGTDGIRGEAGRFPLDRVSVSRIGFALAESFSKRIGRPPRFVSGMDTRESGPEIESALFHGVTAAGGEMISAGVITTPGVAFITAEKQFDAGIVISASHNPHQDNGIKIFLPDGRKSDKELEHYIESFMSIPENGAIGSFNAKEIESDDRLAVSYLKGLRQRFSDLDLSGKKIVLDCANGAASKLAPELFRSFGADVISINDKPNGRNINEDCGSLHLEGLQRTVIDQKADLGLAFDGDADRVLLVDADGSVVDGDGILWILTNEFERLGRLNSRSVVATVMSNIGLEKALESKGIRLIRAAVGDKYVLEGLIESGAEVGGEQSGHIIVPMFGLVGDGMVTGLLVLDAMASTDSMLTRLVADLVTYPQVLVNVRVRTKQPFDEVETISDKAASIENEMNGKGRLLLRYSGTENLARVMIEGEEQHQIEEWANDLAQVIKAELG